MDEPLYTMVNGEPVVSTHGFALLLGVSYEQLRAEIDRQRAEGHDGFRPPDVWIKQSHRIRKKLTAALGYEPGMKEAIDILAARAV